MAAEGQRAPRVASERTNMAAASAAITRPIDHLVNFKIQSSTPFCGGAEDLAWACLEQAYALTLVLSEVAVNTGCGIHGHHLARSIDAITSLVALAQYARENDR